MSANDIRIIRESPDELHRQVWVFYRFSGGFHFHLKGYTVDTRATKRHKWELKESWEWGRQGRIQTHALKDHEVPRPDDVLAEANETVKRMTNAVWGE